MVITDLGVLRPAADGELELVALHPGVEAGRRSTRRPAGTCASPTRSTHTPPVTQGELEELRELRASAGRR